MNYKSFCCSLFFLATFIHCFAQDPSFSQFYANRIYLNPAFTGIEPGLTLAATSRLQWIKVDHGFRTHAITAEFQEPFINSGFGLTVMSNQEGLAELTTQGLGVSYSYTAKFDNSRLHFGIQGQWFQKSFNWDNLIFSDELDPVLGAVNPTTAQLIMENTSYADVSLGAMYRADGNLKLFKQTYHNVRSIIGLSINHLPALFGDAGANESFQKLPTTIPPRVTLHAGSIIPVIIYEGVGNEFLLSPNLKLDLQGEHLFKWRQNLKVLSYGVYALYSGYHFGAFFQNTKPFPDQKNTNALVLSLGWYKDGKRPALLQGQKLYIGFSFDINTTGVGTRGGNVYEFNLRYSFADMPPLFGKRKPTSTKQVLDCKNFLY